MMHQPNMNITAINKATVIEGTLAYGWIKCDTSTGTTLELAYMQGNRAVVIHELLHAVDCADDNELDGSPLPDSEGTCHMAVTDCGHKWVFWAMSHPQQAENIIRNMINNEQTH